MRKNTREVFRAWSQHHAARPSNAIWTDGESIFSYETCLVTRLHHGGGLYAVNVTQYSKTTSTHQNALRDVLYRPSQVLVDDMPKGVSAERLITEAAHLQEMEE